jgi:uncharacterized protein (DUF2236 family)
MTSAAVTPIHDPVPLQFSGYVSGLALVAGGANVIMQLSRYPVGRGVAESKVDSGRLDKHPVKRTRTTLTYLIVAGLGTDEERAWMRREINRSHKAVRSDADSPVAYNAFDRELQLWVAACIYKGYEDVFTLFYGEPSPETQRVFYQHGARFATTLQVTADMWPADRTAFEEYWNAGVKEIRTDRTTRSYLRGIAELGFLPKPLSTVFVPLNRLLTVGFLPQPFRDELDYRWTRRHQAAFNAIIRILATINRLLPRPLREFPFNAYMWDFRRRMRTGRPFV